MAPGGILTWTNSDGLRAHGQSGRSAVRIGRAQSERNVYPDLRDARALITITAPFTRSCRERWWSNESIIHSCGLSILALTSARAQAEPDAAIVATWVISDVASAYRFPPPPSESQTRDEAGVPEGAGNAEGRRCASTWFEYWDAGAPPYRWIQIAQQEIAAHNLGGPAATRAISLVAVAMNDATVAAWASKYAYQRPRPAQFDSTVVAPDRDGPRAPRTRRSTQWPRPPPPGPGISVSGSLDGARCDGLRCWSVTALCGYGVPVRCPSGRYARRYGGGTGDRVGEGGRLRRGLQRFVPAGAGAMEQRHAFVSVGGRLEAVGVEFGEPGSSGASARLRVSGDDRTGRWRQELRAHGADQPDCVVLAAVVHRPLGGHDEPDDV